MTITLSLISPFVGRRFQELENCNSAVREIVLAAPCQHAFYLFSCGTCQMFGEPACNAKPAAIYYLWYSFLKKGIICGIASAKRIQEYRAE